MISFQIEDLQTENYFLKHFNKKYGTMDSIKLLF